MSDGPAMPSSDHDRDVQRLVKAAEQHEPGRGGFRPLARTTLARVYGEGFEAGYYRGLRDAAEDRFDADEAARRARAQEQNQENGP